MHSMSDVPHDSLACRPLATAAAGCHRSRNQNLVSTIAHITQLLCVGKSFVLQGRSQHAMSNFLTDALRAAKQDLETRKSAGRVAKGTKRVRAGGIEKKDSKWLSNRGKDSRSQKDNEAGTGLSDYDLERSRNALEIKAREYKRMFNKGTDMVLTGDAADNLMVDFDRKWAEGHRQDDSDEREDVDEEEDPMIEIQDEFGRARQIRKSDALRHERPVVENERPKNLIYGRHLQGFKPDASKKDAIWAEEKAGREVHYDPNFELRQRGTGYIDLGRGDDRKARMINLKRSREDTLHTRGESLEVPIIKQNPTTHEPQGDAPFIHPSRSNQVKKRPISSQDEQRAKIGADFLDSLLP